MFHGGENGDHRYKLFNLKSDIGEQNNLAAQHPKRVAELDAMIEQHLVATKAARPLANPKFDPARYDVAQEGKAKLKGGSIRKRVGNRKARKPIAQWLPGGTCTLSVSNDRLVVKSTGRDPYLSHALAKPIGNGAFSLQITMSSQSSGNGQFFWRTQASGSFKAERSQTFDVTHDGLQHAYSIPFSVNSPLVAIRIDPSRGPGMINIHDVRLVGEDKTTYYQLKVIENAASTK